jgi:uncharacterized protein YwqG
MSTDFADSRQAVVAVIQEWARETKTPDDTVARIVGGLLPSIRLVRKKGSTKKVGGCRAGGLPDLPEGTAWPHSGPRGALIPMSLILQVDLAEVAAFDLNKELPADGLLSLFYYWDDDGGEDQGRVLYFPAPVGTLHRTDAPEDLPEENEYKSYLLEPRGEWTLPHHGNLGLDEDAEPELEAWFDLDHRVANAQGLGRERTAHRLLGNPDFIQSSCLKKGQVLLLQAGPDYEDDSGMEWGDGGYLFCTLSAADLKAKKLARATVSLEMG